MNTAAALLVLAVETTAAFAAPANWVRAKIDPAHAAIAPFVRTVEAWAPFQASPSKDALYYAVGDGEGTTLDAFAARVKAALPDGTVVTDERTLSLCDGQAGRYLAFTTPTLSVEETIAVGGVFAAVVRYERTAGTLEDADAHKSVQALCPQAETPPSD